MSNYQLFQNDLPSKVLKSFKGDISIDTETLGLNIKRDRLCLIQLRNETDKKIYLIKFEEDLSPKLSKTDKQKIKHVYNQKAKELDGKNLTAVDFFKFLNKFFLNTFLH